MFDDILLANMIPVERSMPEPYDKTPGAASEVPLYLVIRGRSRFDLVEFDSTGWRQVRAIITFPLRDVTHWIKLPETQGQVQVPIPGGFSCSPADLFDGRPIKTSAQEKPRVE